MSDDGRDALTAIVFLGSVFSPWYASRRRRRGDAAVDPLDHAAVNVALRGPAGRRWTMTERGAGAVHRDARSLAIGPSRLAWDGDALVLAIDEIATPWPRRVRGTVRIEPAMRHATAHALDAAGRHRWAPIAPRARVHVELASPRVRWSGDGYLDHNAGDRPLERDFARWQWMRVPQADGGARVFYDVERRDGSRHGLALAFDADGAPARAVAAPPERPLPRTGWRVARSARADGGTEPSVVQTLEDGPFYARSRVATRVEGRDAEGLHESLDLDRFERRWVQAMLPFRVPRRGG